MKKLKPGTFTAEVEEETVLWRDKKRSMFFGLPWTFTAYEITENQLRVSKGFFKRTEEDVMLYRISDISFFQTFGERLNKLGTLCVMSSDTSSPEVHLTHIKNARKVKDFLMQRVEEARKKHGVYASEIVGMQRPGPKSPDGEPSHAPEPPEPPAK